MKQYNHIYTTTDSLYEYLQTHSIDMYAENILIQMFTSLGSKEQIQIIASEIKAVFPNAMLVGASTAGEIINGKMLEKNTVLGISIFEKTQISGYYHIGNDSYELGVNLSKQVFKKETKCVISFLDGLKHNGQEYLHGLSSFNCNNAVIAGGMAADMLDFKQTYTIFGTEVFDGGAVCIALQGDDLDVFQDYNLGWRAVGPTFTITKSYGPRVYEINHRPVKDVYAEVLGEFAVENMPASTIEFPLVYKDGDMLVARSILSLFDDGSILYGGDLEEGKEVHFALGSRTLVNQYAPKDELKDEKSLQACFIYSCIARKQFLNKELQKIFNIIENSAPSSGFFTYGEFFFNENQAKLLNITTTMLFLRERGTQTLQHNINQKQNLKNASKTDGAFFNLVEYVTSELREQERSFKASKFKLDEFLKALDSVVIISRTDTAGIIFYVNEQFEEVSGYTKEELVGKSHNIVRDPDVADEVFKELWTEIKKGNIWKGELVNRAKDGSKYYVKSSIIPIHDENNKITEYMAIHEDVTSLVESRKKAEKAEAAQAMFLANMSHEIRTPMNGILGFTELLSKTKMNESQEKYVNVISNSTKTLLNIVNDILDSSKITNKQITLESIAINPFNEFTTSYELLKSIAQDKKIKYEINMDENISTCIMSDSTRLRQIIINLLSNAIKFTPKYGEVKFNISLISTKERRQKIHFSITDSGVGIAKEKLKEIFKPFAQAEVSTTRRFGGTGLGLSISTDLIQAFGGELKVESREGQGSCFYFDLEFEICAIEKITTENNQSITLCKDEQECGKFHLDVLVAEDYEVNRMLIEAIFKKYKNISLTFAYNGKEAVSKVKAREYDLVFMDINMPIMNGLDATKLIREELHSDVIIVALTANAIKGDREKFIASGMNEYLSKPIKIEKLENILCKYSRKNENKLDINMEDVFQKINDKIGLNQATSLKLIKLFLESLNELVPVLQKAFEMQENKEIYEISHKIKGAAGSLFLDELYEQMQLIEKSALDEDAMQYEDSIGVLYEYINIFEKGVAQYH